jgi:hypothetical protein
VFDEACQSDVFVGLQNDVTDHGQTKQLLGKRVRERPAALLA